MKIIVFVFFVLGVIGIIYFGSDIVKNSKDTMLPDMNSDLVTYLQGLWIDKVNGKHLLRIDRDSITEINNALSTTSTLRYVFSEAASKYFTKDSAFDFVDPSKSPGHSKEFVLSETNNQSGRITSRNIIYVSKTMLNLDSNGKLFRLCRGR